MKTRRTSSELESPAALALAGGLEPATAPPLPFPAPPRAVRRSRVRPGFGLALVRLASCVLAEALVNLAQLALFLLRRRAVRRAARECILQASRASRARDLLFLGSAILLVCSLSSGCAAWNREWRQLEWTVVNLADQRGELKGLWQDLGEIFDPEPDQLLETIVMLGF